MSAQVMFAQRVVELSLPKEIEILQMPGASRLAHPQQAVSKALNDPMGTPPLKDLALGALAGNPNAEAVIVISDNTRPVPYKEAAGILWPVVETLITAGIRRENIFILVAGGTHRPLSSAELQDMLDERVFASGITILQHDCRDRSGLTNLGRTKRGTEIWVNSAYLRADLKIATGLVESHLMAGVSGGRKAICPGLIGEDSTHVFHGAPMLADARARDLVLAGNPCHEEAEEVALAAGVDFILNVTLDHEFRVTGVYGGHLQTAHEAAAAAVRQSAAIPVAKEYDFVITHGGYVGINHYQAAKAATAAIPLLKPGGHLLIIADHTDTDPVGSTAYRTLSHLLRLFGAEKFEQLLNSPDWPFVPDQWQVQMWARLFKKIPLDHLIFYAPQLTPADYAQLPGRDGREFLQEADAHLDPAAKMAAVVSRVWSWQQRRDDIQQPVTAVFLADGPYGIPVPQLR